MIIRKKCPNCGSIFKYEELGAEFVCKSCEVKLSSNKVNVNIGLILVSVLLLPLFLYVISYLLELLEWTPSGFIIHLSILGAIYGFFIILIRTIFIKIIAS